MNAINVAGVINLLGYTMGIALYAMLLAIVLKHPIQRGGPSNSTLTGVYASLSVNGLMLATAVLGLLWNVGAFATYGLRGFGLGRAEGYPLLSAVSFTALGFLPAVVVQSVLLGRLSQTESRISRAISIAAYCLSATAGVLHFHVAFSVGASSSLWALRLLTFGYMALLAGLFLSTHRQEGWKKAVWATALAVFAVSALHLSHHRGGGADEWYTELLGHHASLPLALAILYEDYRFAFADIFLKRALALLALVALAFGLYLAVASPLLVARNSGAQVDTRVVTALVGLWVITALLYPWLRRGVVRFVDSIILRRADYGKLRADVAHLLTEQETSHDILEEVCQVLGPALSADGISWAEIGETEFTETSRIPGETEDAENDGNAETTPRLALTMRLIKSEPRLQEPRDNDYVTLLEGSGSKSAVVLIPTAEPPYFRFNIGTLAGGRRLLSDDIAMLDAVAVMVARRVDALRVTHERCEQNLREQEINKLATEAQLRALRAQVNPHFLFNALTTIGYLVQTSPDRALETLMKLTSLLRGVLRSDGEFVTLGEELELIASYLDIERARFEERLRTTVDVPENLRSLRLPSLLVQPLVENAIKHGITPSRFGGEVNISARLEDSFAAASKTGEVLSIKVSDTGVGASEIEMARGRRRGLGLNNIEERLRCYGGQSASLRIASIPTHGTIVELRIPVAISQRLPNETSGARLQNIKEKKGA
jgi:two-component system LytT family sensor kinase